MNDNDFIIGGYFLVRHTERADYMDKNLISNRIITVSDCICDELIGQWAIEWSSEHKKIDYYNNILKLSKHKLRELINDMTRLYDSKKFGFGYIFTELEVARKIHKKYLSHIDGVKLLGIGLKEDGYEVFKVYEDLENNNAHYGVNICFNRKELMDTSNVLGYDILGYEYGHFHSYLCNGLEKDIYNQLKIKPNNDGLFDDYDKAREATDYIDDDSIGAEPVLWQTWIVCEYSL